MASRAASAVLRHPERHPRRPPTVTEGTRLLKSAAGTLVVRVTGTALSFAVGVALARVLGVTGFGVYAYAMSWLGVAGVLAGLGTGELLIRETAIDQTDGNRCRTADFVRWARLSVLSSSVLIAGLALAVAWTTNALASPLAGAILFAALLLPLNALVGVNQSVLLGMRRTVAAFIPEMVLRPVVLLTLLGAGYLLVGHSIGPGAAIGLQLVGTAIAFAVGARLIAATTHDVAGRAESEFYAWFRGALPFLLIGLLYVINNRADILMLGWLRGTASAGVYAAAVSGAQLVSFILLVANTALAPTVASLYRKGHHHYLQWTVTRSARFILLATTPVAALLIGFGGRFLALYGPDFAQGRAALTILCLAQFVNVAMGSVALLLNMTGHERWTLSGVAVAASVNIVLNAVLIPGWGLSGAATATFISMAGWNLLLLVGVRKKLGIDPTAFGFNERL